MKILVTGGVGFIGSNLIEQLLKENHSITSLDNYSSGRKENELTGVNYFFGNTWDIYQIFEDEIFDIVFHFGEYSRIWKSFERSGDVLENNLYGTLKVIEMCKRWKAKLIYSATSSSLNGKADLSPYSFSKSKNVELIKNYRKWFGLEYEICYFFNVYGKNQIEAGEYSTVIGVFEKQFREKTPLTIVKPGTQRRNFTDIRDIVDGLIKAMKINENGEWFLKNNKDYSIDEIAELFNHSTTYIEERPGERFIAFKGDSDTEECLNWRCQHNLEDWIKNSTSRS